jgi:hypothetical protein
VPGGPHVPAALRLRRVGLPARCEDAGEQRRRRGHCGGALRIGSQEAARLRWDTAWLWGRPDDQLAPSYKAVGRERLVLGTHFPFRLPEAALTKLALAE